jgi:hypothetical protein
MLQNSAQDAKDKLLFKWLKGAQTDLSNFGDPLNSADYALCLYTGPQRAPLTHFSIANDSAKWQPLSTRGYRYIKGRQCRRRHQGAAQERRG